MYVPFLDHDSVQIRDGLLIQFTIAQEDGLGYGGQQ